jgi:hypothetical protein
MIEPTEPQGPMPERRTETSVLLALVQTVHDDVKTMHTNLTALDLRLTKHMTEETMELAREISKLMSDAFPEGDPSGHRKHHEAVIAKAEARAAFWRKMLEEIIKYGLVGLVGWLALTVWSAFLQGPHK